MNKSIRIVVCGSRDFKNMQLLTEKLDNILSQMDLDEVEIMSGCAQGADRLGEKYAEAREIQIHEYPANWKLNGKKAGYRRNERMAKYATHVVAFWDGKSRSTQHMIRLAKQKKLPLRVIRF